MGTTEFRELTPEEVVSLPAEAFPGYGGPPPGSRYFGAVENGKVVASIMVQIIPHVEGIWAAPEKRGNKEFKTSAFAKLREWFLQHGITFFISQLHSQQAAASAIGKNLNGEELPGKTFLFDLTKE